MGLKLDQYVEALDFGGIEGAEKRTVIAAIKRGENFFGYMPGYGLEFIVRNYRALAALDVLEGAWLSAYEHASHFAAYGVLQTKAIFDACNKQRLLTMNPLGDLATLESGGRVTLFRGCAGPSHEMGMSWSPSLDKAIWYAARHAEYGELSNPAVYVSIIPLEEIYCRLNHYDAFGDFITYAGEAWRVEAPASEFRIDRRR